MIITSFAELPWQKNPFLPPYVPLRQRCPQNYSRHHVKQPSKSPVENTLCLPPQLTETRDLSYLYTVEQGGEVMASKESPQFLPIVIKYKTSQPDTLNSIMSSLAF